MHALVRRLCALCCLGLTTTLLAVACAGGGESEGGGKGGVAGKDGGDVALGGSSGSGGSGGTAGKSGSSGTGGSVAGAAGADASADASDASEDGDAEVDGDAGEEPTPCYLIPEDCNGLDDNCNGQIDEGNPGGGGPCTDPSKQGVCADGTLTCQNGSLACVQNVQPSVEQCNGLDDNCNGAVDEGDPGGNVECNTGLQGICALGTTSCANGTITCLQNAQPQTEICNGLDDDCDGTPDDGYPGSGQPCTVAGQTPGTPCAQGLTNCLGGQSGCSQVNFPSSETCDGKDNDCNGTIDDPSALDGVACTTTYPGVCTDGLTKCSSGTLTCQAKIQPGTQAETCNALDDNCDGTVDNVSNIGADCLAKLPQATKVATWACAAGFCSIVSCVTNYGDCDSVPNNGCETDLLKEVTSCGGCGKICNSNNGSAYCELGTCKIACDPGFGNCDGSPDNGCETPLTSIANCGGCGIACTNPNGTTLCSLMKCVPTCSAGYGNCDGNANNGCETNTSNNTNNCGACGTVCTNTNGTTSCAGGLCAPICDAGFGNCDANPTNGCETSLLTSITNCGSCAKVCTNPNGTTVCIGGACVPSCAAGSGDCDGNPTNGCETNINTNKDNCGACANKCTNANGSTSCVAGTCTPICTAGFASCDGDPDNGCETSINTLSNCGGCGKVCDLANASESCVAGVCTLGSCNVGWDNCDANPANGCEVNLDVSISNCGACGTVCTNANGTTSCVGGVCTPVCSSGFKSCDGNPNNGCETNTNTDVNNCNSCGNKCSSSGGTPSCVGGVCQIGCNLGWADCDGNAGNGCETSITTVSHCGSCSVACTNPNGSTACVSGACSPTCTLGFGSCDGNLNNGCETSLLTVANCGACGFSCTNAHGATACVGGACAPTCDPGWGNCDGNPANGCETPLNTLTNCGACGAACSRANATATCSTGSCAISSCNAGFGNCDGSDANGCETDTQTTVAHCGGCGQPCSSANGSAVCSNGACSITCNAGWANCDADARANGCEANTTSDVTNCGTCGLSCAASAGPNVTGEVCTGGACKVSSCTAGYFDQNGIFSDGCECAGDPYGDACNLATDLGTLAIGATNSKSGNVVPTGDSDWFRITFATAGICTYHPKITLSMGGLPIAMRVYTACASGSPSGGQTCTEGGTSGSKDVTLWEYANSLLCGDNLAIDPTPATGAYITLPVTVWVQVIATASSTSCLPYTLTFAN